MDTEFSRNMVKRLIEIGKLHIDVNFGEGSSARVLQLYDEYFNAMDSNNLYETEDSNWRLDLAKNNVFEELHRGLRIC